MYITWHVVRENTLPCIAVSQTGYRVKYTSMAPSAVQGIQ